VAVAMRAPPVLEAADCTCEEAYILSVISPCVCLYSSKNMESCTAAQHKAIHSCQAQSAILCSLP
jgi:hypothetical protein